MARRAKIAARMGCSFLFCRASYRKTASHFSGRTLVGGNRMCAEELGSARLRGFSDAKAGEAHSV